MRTRHGGAAEIAHGLHRHGVVDGSGQRERMALPHLCGDVGQQPVDEMVHLVRRAHVCDRLQRHLELVGVGVDGLASALAQLVQALARQHRGLHRAVALAQRGEELGPRQADDGLGWFLVPPVDSGTVQIRHGEFDARCVVGERAVVVRELLLQFADPIVHSEAHFAFELRRGADLRQTGSRLCAGCGTVRLRLCLHCRLLCCLQLLLLLLLLLMQLHDLRLQLCDDVGLRDSSGTGDRVARRRLRRRLRMHVLLLGHGGGGAEGDGER